MGEKTKNQQREKGKKFLEGKEERQKEKERENKTRQKEEGKKRNWARDRRVRKQVMKSKTHERIYTWPAFK